MPHFWDYFTKSSPPQHNLQEGLFQIASQTCNLLVQVNNTNNINFGDNSTNINCNNLPSATTTVPTDFTHVDQEQLVVLLPGKNRQRSKSCSLRKPRLSTVLEAPTLTNDEESELWNNGYVLPGNHDGSPSRRWGAKHTWCRPSCIPISIILLLIFLVVLLPVLDHAAHKSSRIPVAAAINKCPNTCSISLVESIPEGLVYPNNTTPYPSTYQTWLDFIENVEESIDIASFYWTLRESDVYPDPSSQEGEDIFQAILKAGTDRGITIRIAQNAPTQDQPNRDTEYLVKRKAAEVRSLNFAKLLGAGVLHTKMWIFDKKHFYIGSANMDWRALTQVKEMGIIVQNCTCLTEDVSKIFEVYWQLGENGSTIPDVWPSSLETKYNIETPINISYSGDLFQTYISSAPPQFCPNGRANDIDAVLSVIKHAERFIYIAVMDYFPLTIYTPRARFWPVIDDALRRSAIEERVQVRLLVSWWNHSRTDEDFFLRSLADISGAIPRLSIEVRRFIVPGTEEQHKIPFGRVNHNKYMVTDNTAYIGTSNWSGDYFINTAGVGFVVHDPVYNRNSSEVNIRSQLQSVFERDWNSTYAHPIDTYMSNLNDQLSKANKTTDN